MDQELDMLEQRPHLVILGAGATKATIPTGDKNGYKTSVMDNFLEELQLTDVLTDVKLETRSRNIEDIYSELYERKDCNDVRSILEKKIRNYFEVLQLPDEPTIYDYLILSLRSKDCIASFNWDGLLIQAYNRIRKITKDLPELAFLHGCVEVGICMPCKRFDPLRNRVCPCCKQPLAPVPILFPVKNKDYTSNIFIKQQWNVFSDYISKAGLVTIFGYSAPKTDVEAVNILKSEFSNTNRFLDNFEVIDKADRNLIKDRWSYFAERTNWHIDVHETFFESILSEYPRRSMEGYVKRNLRGWWGECSIKYTNNMTFDELQKLVEPLLKNERLDDFSVL